MDGCVRSKRIQSNVGKCRLRAGAMVNKNQKERAVEPYATQEEFTQALDKFASFYKIVRRDPNESEEAGIMRLAESLANNAGVLQVPVQ